MLTCKIFQALEPPHTLSAGMISPRQERSVLRRVDSTNLGYKCQGIVINVNVIASISIITGQIKRMFFLIILPKFFSNSKSKQLSQDVSKHAESLAPSSAVPQVLKTCKSGYYW